MFTSVSNEQELIIITVADKSCGNHSVLMTSPSFHNCSDGWWSQQSCDCSGGVAVCYGGL